MKDCNDKKGSIRISSNKTKSIIRIEKSWPPKRIHDDIDLNHDDSESPKRKRANLSHMTSEEKMKRRRLMNRVAAQNARDKKKVKLEKMEKIIESMESELENLREENQRLWQDHDRLQSVDSVVVRPAQSAELSDLLQWGQGRTRAVSHSLNWMIRPWIKLWTSWIKSCNLIHVWMI